MKSPVFALLAASLLSTSAMAQVPTGTMGPLRPDQQRFRDLYEELVETNTTLSAGAIATAPSAIAASAAFIVGTPPWKARN